ncbi:hypothetical protein [Dyella sp.]|uniref:hypothetical protein n=1 Tax=Dyella sp. TaxID=1869338 RepID=UPI002852CEB4|nr:hypothetical protein [Dyella sp.]
MKHVAASALFIVPLLALAQNTPPVQCNMDSTRTYMREQVAKQMFVPPEKIQAIATLGGAGGDSGSSGKPGDRAYHSEMNCPIRVTVVGGGHKYMTYHERFSTIYGEEVQFTPLSMDPADPQLKWIDTAFR